MTRRGVLKRLGAGGAAVIASPALLAPGRPPVRKAADRGTAQSGPLPADRAAASAASGTGLHGATLDLSAFPPGTTWAEAIQAWNGFTATKIRACKVYFGPSQFPTSITWDIQAFIDNDIKALLCFKPAVPFKAADLAALKSTLLMYKLAGLKADVTLWQEPQDVMSVLDYRRAVRDYGPAVRHYYRLAYDAGSHGAPAEWTSYYPGDAQIDIVAVDYYAGSYVGGARLEGIAKLADYAKPAMAFGLWEMGVSASNTGPSVSETQVHEYFAYVQWFMSRRVKAGKANAEIAWYNGDGVNTIDSSSDYRVPLWNSLVAATSV